MTTTAERAEILASHCLEMGSDLFLGDFSTEGLIQWVSKELGNPEILDSYTPYGKNSQYTKAIPYGPILHILSGNTEHAGHQSLLRGLLVGAQNIVKLPSTGLHELEKWIKNLPPELGDLVTSSKELSEQAFRSAKTIIAIGSDNTIAEIQQRILPHQRFIPHGHKLSIGLIDKPSKEAARLAVQDACAFNQQGCLSLHSIYVMKDAPSLLPLIAEAMAEYEKVNPRRSLTLSESGAISNLRETVRYEVASDPENTAILHSSGNTNWTVIYRNSPTLIPSVLNRVITIQPWPDDISELGSERHYLSTLAMEPELLNTEINYEISRICPLGQSQQPTLDWHHDGFLPLGSLVRWLDMQL